MRIAHETPDRLTLESRPWVLGSVLALVILLMAAISLSTIGQNLWLGLGMALGAGLFGLCFVVFVRRVIVILDRPAGALVIRTASLTGQRNAASPSPPCARRWSKPRSAAPTGRAAGTSSVSRTTAPSSTPTKAPCP